MAGTSRKPDAVYLVKVDDSVTLPVYLWNAKGSRNICALKDVVIVLVHQYTKMGGCEALMRGMARRFAAGGFPTLTFDMYDKSGPVVDLQRIHHKRECVRRRGAGRSTGTATFTGQREIKDVEAVCLFAHSTLKKNILLVGSSAGAPIAGSALPLTSNVVAFVGIRSCVAVSTANYDELPVQYDTDVTVWSPQGRIFQVEYAMEAVKQGSCTVGIVGKDFAVLATLNRTQAELSSTLKKMFKVDEHMGIAMSGVTADGRIMCRYMCNECLSHRFTFESSLPVGRLVRNVADKHQVRTQRSWCRPYGVGLLVVGVDSSGPQLYETSPSGQFWKYKAMAIGARSQAAKTYLERKLEEFPANSKDELMMHALTALQASQQDGDITTENVTLGVVGTDQPFTVLEGATLAPFISQLEDDQPAAPAVNIPDDDGAAPMET